MRSLFAKILGWFVASILGTIAATVPTSALTYDADSSRQGPFSMLLSLEVREARHAWESGGGGGITRRARPPARSDACIAGHAAGRRGSGPADGRIARRHVALCGGPDPFSFSVPIAHFRAQIHRRSLLPAPGARKLVFLVPASGAFAGAGAAGSIARPT